MQITPTNSSFTLSQMVAPSAAIAEVLPKNGEAPVNALFAPVEEVNEAAVMAAVHKEPVVYGKPLVKPHSKDKNETAETAKGEQDETQQKLLNAKISEAEARESNVQGQRQQKEDALLVQELKQRDQEVRNHEQAHMAMGGQHAGSASYTFQQGPDGVRYAVGGEVPIDLSATADPEDTLEKMEQIQRAALAPSEPSSQDRQVAAQAGQKAAEALREISEQKLEAREQQRQEEQEALKAEREKAKTEEEKAKKEQEEAEKKDKQQEQVSVAERFSQYNLRMARINETLLRLSVPPAHTAGQLLKAKV